MKKSADSDFFKKRIIELADLCGNNGAAVFTSFFTESEQETAFAFIKNNVNGVHCSFNGGFNEAERKVLGFFPESETVFPIKAVLFKYKSFSETKLSHRDFLGAVMNLGLKREVIGDIVTSSDYSVVFCLEKVAPLISGLLKISNTGVKTEIINTSEFILPDTDFIEIDGIVSGLRLDSVLSAAVKLSREKAQSLINNGSIKIKGIEIYDHSKLLEESASFTVKGFGKFKISDVGRITKSGRIHIKIKKFK